MCASNSCKGSCQSLCADPSGIVFDIQRAALHDGPGIRTTVFLKGCPLRCAWCHNPESQRREPQVGASGKVYGKLMRVSEVMETVLADVPYYQRSGGGVTLSGGEPTLQFHFCLALLRAAKANGIATCLDTSGHVPQDRLLQLLPWVDLFHFDWKLSNAADHLRWTGVDGALIRSNLAVLRQRGCSIILRCPIVPGVNDTPEHEHLLKEFESTGDFLAVERLPYHSIGESKARDLGLTPMRFETASPHR